jgi:nicotinic acetylcholine receptor
MASKETKILRSMSLKMTLDNIAQELQNDIQMENGMADTVVTDNQGTSLHSPRDIRFNSLQGENLRRGRTKTSRGHAYSRINDEILQSLQKVIDKHEREDYDYEIIKDWRRVAQVVDRVLFWIFFLGTLISTIIVLIICPTFR